VGDGGFEADLEWVNGVFAGGLPDGESDEVVGEDMDGEFLLDHVGRLASQYVHPHGDLDVSQEQFGEPPAPVEFLEGVGGEGSMVEQRGGDLDGVRAKSGYRDVDGDVPNL
jgi:hypothetical protein